MRIAALLATVSVLALSACGDDPLPVVTVDGGTDSGENPDLGDGDLGVERPDLGPVCPPPAETTIGENFFTDISNESGINAENFVPMPDPPIPLNDHSRIGMADINGDGCDDAVMHSLFVNWTMSMIPFEHLVFLNNCDGTGTFTNFSDESGLRDVQVAFFVFGDVDNDGDQDCFGGLDTTIAGRANVLLLNDGSGHFTVRANSGVEGPAGNVVAGNAVFADFNNDANLDIFIGNGQTSYAAQDNLYFGGGDGTFTNATARLAFNTQTVSNGTVACDYDNDGDQDVYVSTYGVSNFGAQDMLWENDGEGNFTNVGIERGISSLATGNYWLPQTGMGTTAEPGHAPGEYIGGNGFGVQCEDIDNDGDMDIFLANISHPVASDYNRKWSDPSILFINGGAESGYTFTNEFLARGLPFNEGDIDASLADFDNDGFLDIGVTREKKYEGGYTTDDQLGYFGLMHQRPDGTFESVGVRSGISMNADFATSDTGQGLAWSDVDHDGDLDVLLGERHGGVGHANQLFRNDLPAGNNWMQIRVEGDGEHVTRDAFGTRVRFVYNGYAIARELKSSRGTYSSMDSRTLHFGLGQIGCAYYVEVRWPDNTVQIFTSEQIGMNRFITIKYAEGVVVD